LNIQQLEYIIAVDQFKSFANAAEHCYVTQAYLSATVRKLEVELNTNFFDRRSRSVVTTPAGVELIKEARQIVQHSQLLMDKAKKINRTIAGPIKIGMLPTLANSLFPMVSKSVLEYYPDLKPEVTESTADKIVDQVKEGQLDMGVVVSKALPQEIGKVILFHEALMVYGDSKSGKVWVYDEGHLAREQFKSLFSSKEHDFENQTIEPGRIDLLLNGIDELGGSTLIPELYYQTLSDERKELITSFSLPAPVREVSMVFHKKYTNIKIVQALADLIRSQINETLKSQHFNKHEIDVLSL
jgi:LysR family hydrogen peroxide-inducible transcriptional activator